MFLIEILRKRRFCKIKPHFERKFRNYPHKQKKPARKFLNVKGNENLSLLEINSAISIINDQISEDANVIFGTVIDNNMNDEVGVTIIATGVEETVAVK